MPKPTDRRGYVYVLHFNQLFEHARHYVGCTTNLRQRLITHAKGNGAVIVREAMARGITWQVGAIGQTTLTAVRRIERQIKNWHGPARLCSICNTENEHGIPGCTGMPLAEMPFPLDSPTLKTLSGPAKSTVRFATEADTVTFMFQIQRLMQLNKDALGFIPAGGEGGLTLSVRAGRVIVAELDNVPCGYLMFTENESTAKIQQCVVEDSQRGCGFGRQMVEMLRNSRAEKMTECRVRSDLHARGFWEQIGFTEIGRDTHATSGSELIEYAQTPLVADFAGYSA